MTQRKRSPKAAKTNIAAYFSASSARLEGPKGTDTVTSSLNDSPPQVGQGAHRAVNFFL